MHIRHLALAALTASALITSVSQAALIGTTVTGVLNFTGFGTTNYFDPAVGSVPTGFGYLNTASPTVVVAEPATEFGYQDGAARVSANITDTQILMQEQALSGGGSYNSYVIKLTDIAFTGAGVSISADTFPGTTASISGTTLTINVPLHNQGANTLALALYNVTIPEPTSAMALGGLALFGLRRHRRA